MGGDVDALFDDIRSCPTMAGKLHVLVSNAGSSGPTAPIEKVSLLDWSECIAVNLNGSFMMCQHAIPLMRNTLAAGTGHGCSIITISSTAGFLGYPNRTPY